MIKRKLRFLCSTVFVSFALLGCARAVELTDTVVPNKDIEWTAGDIANIVETSTEDIDDQKDIFEVENLLKEIPYIQIGNNMPQFSDEEKDSDMPFERYSQLDELDRCGAAYANIDQSLMPTEKRGAIGYIQPTGWIQNKYDKAVNSSPPYLYNRCHLIGYQLTGENDNEKNLITGTRYMNVEGMLPLEEVVADYIRETGHHVLYRVTPIFVGNELLCRGVTMEAWSVEDQGTDICFYVFCPNVQPGVVIDYATGDNWLNSEERTSFSNKMYADITDYVLNKNSKKYHLPSCDSVEDISVKNRKEYHGTQQELEKDGYTACKKCIK